MALPLDKPLISLDVWRCCQSAANSSPPTKGLFVTVRLAGERPPLGQGGRSAELVGLMVDEVAFGAILLTVPFGGHGLVSSSSGQ